MNIFVTAFNYEQTEDCFRSTTKLLNFHELEVDWLEDNRCVSYWSNVLMVSIVQIFHRQTSFVSSSNENSVPY